MEKEETEGTVGKNRFFSSVENLGVGDRNGFFRRKGLKGYFGVTQCTL